LDFLASCRLDSTQESLVCLFKNNLWRNWRDAAAAIKVIKIAQLPGSLELNEYWEKRHEMSAIFVLRRPSFVRNKKLIKFEYLMK